MLPTDGIGGINGTSGIDVKSLHTPIPRQMPFPRASKTLFNHSYWCHVVLALHNFSGVPPPDNKQSVLQPLTTAELTAEGRRAERPQGNVTVCVA